jgi:murein DD-endopeptidase MepM/ murein hydrolase activator NlpD
MLSLRPRTSTAAAVLITALLAALAAGIALSESPAAHATGIGQLQQQISAGQSKINALSGAVNAANGQLNKLNGGIDALQNRISALQANLDAKRVELLKLQTQLIAARQRLTQLEAFEAKAEYTLSQQLVNAYEAGRPDLVTVILEANGFQDLLERLSFAQRIQKQDVAIVRSVRAARRAVAAQAIRLGALEVRQQQLATQILGERNSVATAQAALLRQRIGVLQARAIKAGELAQVRGQVSSLRGQLAQAEAAAAATQAPAASVPQGASSPAGSAGGFTFPLPKSAASSPGSWSEDQGVDISAPGDTPEFAVCSGTIVLHGIGGFGPWAPVLHCDSPIDGYDYVYYGHAGPADQLPVGTHVGAGQVMSSIGPGIVGISTGPHLEIGFADSSGSPIGGGSASTMMSLLQASY